MVAEDDVDAEVIRSLDRSIYRKKRFLIAHPQYREEIDCLIKPISRVRDQLEFATFESMIACKILHEGKLLYASPAVFQTVKDLVAEHGIPQQLMNLERQAAANRELAEARLLDLGDEGYKSESYNLFYTQEQGDEIY